MKRHTTSTAAFTARPTSVICRLFGHWWRYGDLLTNDNIPIGWTRACRFCGTRQEKIHPQQAWH